MLRLKDENIPLPEKYPVVKRVLPTAKKDGVDKFGNFIIREDFDICPQHGLQEEVVASECNLIFLAGEATMGKGADYKTPISTPDGWVTMGELQVGTVISDTEGGAQIVEQIFELGETDLFEVSLYDGATTRCTREHLWKCKFTKQHHKAYWDVITLENLLEYFNKKEDSQHVYIPLPKPILYNKKKDLPIHPYVLGALIGDGGMGRHNNPISIHSIDEYILNRFEELGYKLKDNGNRTNFIIHPTIRDDIKELGLIGLLSYDKFIPEIYKYATIEERTELLRGLMDTDGNVEKFHVMRYSTSSMRLAKDVQELVWGLGGTCNIKNKRPFYTYKGRRLEGRPSYYLNINFENQLNFVTLPKKAERCQPSQNKRTELCREIVGIRYLGKEKCRCIRVSNANKLYVTDNYIVTHNTFSGFLKALNGVDKPKYTAKLISKRLLDNKKGGSLLRDFKVIFDGFAGSELLLGDYPVASWRQWNSSIQMIHMNFNTKNEAEWKEFQDYAKKTQASYIYWDEVTDIDEFRAFVYMFSRNRDFSGMLPISVCSFNPLHEHWTTELMRLGGYISNDWYLIPEMIGKVRYFRVLGDTVESTIFADTREEIIRRCGLEPTEKEKAAEIDTNDLIKSFTVFSGCAADNRLLVNKTKGGSIANLYNVTETERMKIKFGYFGPIEKNEIRISQQQIADIFINPYDHDEQMYATMDVSGGGDICPMFIWRGHTIIAIETISSGDPEEIEMWAMAQLHKYDVPMENFAFDATGMGFFMKRFKQGMPCVANTSPIIEYDEAGNQVVMEKYYKLRSQLYGKLETMIKKEEISCSIDKFEIFPHGPKKTPTRLIDIFVEERNVFVRRDKNGRIYYREKGEFKTQYKLSPDYIDAMSLRCRFDLDARPRKEAARIYTEDDYVLCWDRDIQDLEYGDFLESV